MTFNINGKSYAVDCDPNMPLLWAIRDIVGLTGTKYGCGIAICRACTVWIDGSPEKSCEKKASEGTRVQITTIEGLAATPQGARLQQAFIDCQTPQCGYCQSGMLMAATKLLRSKSHPTDADIDAAIGNICVCGTYPRVKEAIKVAANAAGASATTGAATGTGTSSATGTPTSTPTRTRTKRSRRR